MAILFVSLNIMLLFAFMAQCLIVRNIFDKSKVFYVEIDHMA